MELNDISISEDKQGEETVIIKHNTVENKIEENVYVNTSLVVDTIVLDTRESHVYDHLQRSHDTASHCKGGCITRFKQYKDCIMLSLIGVLFIAVTVLAIFIGLPEKSVTGEMGVWNTWEGWGDCSATCSYGMERRERKCSFSSEKQCYGDSNEYRICNKMLCPEPYENGGSCTDGVNSYACTCVSGFTGSTCSHINDCVPNPCQNSGTCYDGVNSYTCTCVSGFTGPRCQTNIEDCSPNMCQNGGTCIDGVDDFTCTCAVGFSGRTCQTKLLIISQWVQTVTHFSSQAGDTRWNANQVVGSPDVYPNYGDYSNQWEPSSQEKYAILQVQFAEAVYITGVRVYETYRAGGVTAIKALDGLDNWITLWSTSTVEIIETARILAPVLSVAMNSPSRDVRIEVDLTANRYRGFDAVQLLGTK